MTFALMGSAYASRISQAIRGRAWRSCRTAPRPAKARPRSSRRIACCTRPPAQLRRQRRGRRHPARHGRRGGLLRLRRQRGDQDARGRLGDGRAARPATPRRSALCGARAWRCSRAASSASRSSPTGSSTAARRCSASIGCSSRRTAARSARAIPNAVKVAAKAVAGRAADDIESALRVPRAPSGMRLASLVARATRIAAQAPAPVEPDGPSALAREPPARSCPAAARLSLGSRQDLPARPSSTPSSRLLRSAFEGAEPKAVGPRRAALLRELRAAAACAHLLHLRLAAPDAPRAHAEAPARRRRVRRVHPQAQPARTCMRGRFRAMREQVGYKLPALLAAAPALAAATRETCFGDDAEADAFIYSLYGDVLAGRVGARAARGDPRAPPTSTTTSAQRAGRSPSADRRRRRAAHLHPPRSPLADRALRSLRRPRRAHLQLFPGGAGALRGWSALDAQRWCASRSRWSNRYGYTIDALRNSLQDLLRRGRLRRSTTGMLADELADENPQPRRPSLARSS